MTSGRGASLFALITPPIGGAVNSTQIAAYIVSGIGFLAHNTGATSWCTAAVGALAGYGFLIEAAIGLLAVLAANVLLRPVVQRINR